MKTVEEWSNAFDVLVADYIHINGFGLESPIAFDEYEKSLFLTKALESVVQDIYNGRLAIASFETTEEARRQLDSLVCTKSYNEEAVVEGTSEEESTLIVVPILLDKFIHTSYSLPPDCWYIVYELATYGNSSNTCINGSIADIVPCTHDEYQRTVNNPFRGPNKKRVLRLDIGNLIVELISQYTIRDYTIRYIKKPSPIILCDLEEGLEINGESTSLTCELSDLIHQEILNRAVAAALSSRVNTTNKDKASN